MNIVHCIKVATALLLMQLSMVSSNANYSVGQTSMHLVLELLVMPLYPCVHVYLMCSIRICWVYVTYYCMACWVLLLWSNHVQTSKQPHQQHITQDSFLMHMFQ